MSSPTGAKWLWNPRWVKSHIVGPTRAHYIGAHTTSYGVTGCGRHVNADTLQPEPTGIDTLPRCQRCREYAAKNSMDAES